MNVRELAELLLRHDDQAAEVLVEGYEGGFSPIAAVTAREVQELDRDAEIDYLGRYETPTEAARQLGLDASAPELRIAGLNPPTAIGGPRPAVVLYREHRRS